MPRNDAGSAPPAADLRCEQLLGEERVPVRALEGVVEELDRRVVADDRGDELAQLVTVEARQLDPFGNPGAVELGQRGAQRVPAVQVIRTVCADHDDTRVVEAAGEEHEEVDRRAIGPMQILDHEQGRDPVAEPFQDAEQLLEQRRRADRLGRRARVQLGDECGELFRRRTDDGLEGRGVDRTVERPQRLHDRAERQRPVDELHALAVEHQRGLADPRLELGEEAGLADAGLSRHEEHRGRFVVHGRLPDPLEPRELGAPADEPRARHPRRHGSPVCCTAAPARRRDRTRSRPQQERPQAAAARLTPAP